MNQEQAKAYLFFYERYLVEAKREVEQLESRCDELRRILDQD